VRSTGEIERAKLTANFLNSLASGTILAAIVAPYIGWSLGTVPVGQNFGNILGLSAFGFVIGVVLHLLARRALGGLDE
jgi:hypothetical protein